MSIPDAAAEIRRRHDAAQAADRMTYVDPVTGFHVMTAATLTAQGHCCGSGCRHCPWPPEEQRRAGRPGS